MTINTLWYISKYVCPPLSGTVGSRGFCLMREIAKNGVHSVIITSDSNHLIESKHLSSSYTSEMIDGVDMLWVKTLKYKLPSSFMRVLSWFHFEWKLLQLNTHLVARPDAIIVSSLSLLTVLTGLYFRFRFQCKLVFEVRDIWPLTLIAEGGWSSWNPFVIFLGLIEYIGYRYSDLIVGTMPNLHEHVSVTLGYSRPVYCIPMGVDVGFDKYRKQVSTKWKRDFIPSDKFVVGYVGSIGLTNALDTMLKCAESLSFRDDIHFLIVGDGAMKRYFIERFGHLANVTIAPRVSKAEVSSVLEQCNLLYLSSYPSSVWKFGQSMNKLIDYMLSARPILASYSGFRSMINESSCGEFLESGDELGLRLAVERYSSFSPEKLASMGNKGRAWVLKNRLYSTLSAHYLSIISEHESATVCS